MTKERPILFSGVMVRAILDGRKTQTRRVMSERHRYHFIDDCGDLALCPYGQPGDRMWVRESFWGCDAPGYGDIPCVVYDDEWHGKGYQPAEVRPWAPKFGRIPSIHMPRNCSRITLEVTGVRVERLNDCSEEDALAEGVFKPGPSGNLPIGPCVQRVSDGNEIVYCQRGMATAEYRELWDQINGAGAWAANPWVWVVEFRKAS